jgi:hypothetical protein
MRENTIRIALRDVGWGGIERIELAQDTDQWMAFVNTEIHFGIP